MRLDRHADLDELQRAGRFGDVELLDGLPVGDEGAAADATLNELLFGQLAERLAHRAARGVVVRRERALRRQPLAFGVDPGDDGLAQLGRDSGGTAR